MSRLSPSVSCLTSVLGVLQVCGSTAWLRSVLCDRLHGGGVVNVSIQIQSVRSPICDLTVASKNTSPSNSSVTSTGMVEEFDSFYFY